MLIETDPVLGQMGTSTQLIAGDPDMAERFATIGGSMATLFQVMTIGEIDVWKIGKHIPAAWAFFIFFTLLATLGLINLLTGVFLKALIDKTQDEKDLDKMAANAAKQRMIAVISELFKKHDINQSGAIDPMEMERLLADCEQYADLLESVGLPVAKVDQICRNADWAHTGHLVEKETGRVHRLDTKGLDPITVENTWEGVAANEVPAKYPEEGVLEGELVDSLLNMGLPVTERHFYTLVSTHLHC